MTGLTHDLHIHSCLSPCGDDDMTPANIGMAAPKGLEAVALTDYNTCRNCPAFMAAARGIRRAGSAGHGKSIRLRKSTQCACFPIWRRRSVLIPYVYGKLIRFPNNEAIFGKGRYTMKRSGVRHRAQPSDKCHGNFF